MKNQFLFLCFNLILITAIHSQSNFSLHGGVKLIRPNQREITLWYVDESPSRDNIFKTVKQSGKISYSFAARWQDANPTKLFHIFIEGQGYVGSINGLSLNLGLSYRKRFDRKFVIQPELPLIFGFSSKGLGAIENNDLYIKVNKTQFQDITNVNVSIRNTYFGIKPGLSFIFKIKSGSEIGIGANYQLSIKKGGVAFSGKGQDGLQASAFENFKEKNVGFYVEGEQTDVIPYNPDGLEIKLFYVF